MRIILLLVFVITVLVGCKKESTKWDITKVEIDHVLDSISFDSIITDYQYIELSQNKGFVLGEIDQVIIDNDHIYVSSDGVYCYDMKGNPLFKITSKGHAKNEFTECTSISINEGMIYIYDINTKLIHRYNSVNGKFVDNIPIPLISRDIYKIEDKYVIDHLFPTDFYSGDARIITTKDFSGLDGSGVRQMRTAA